MSGDAASRRKRRLRATAPSPSSQPACGSALPSKLEIAREPLTVAARNSLPRLPFRSNGYHSDCNAGPSTLPESRQDATKRRRDSRPRLRAPAGSRPVRIYRSANRAPPRQLAEATVPLIRVTAPLATLLTASPTRMGGARKHVATVHQREAPQVKATHAVFFWAASNCAYASRLKSRDQIACVASSMRSRMTPSAGTTVGT
jgi:hypothetical protein